MDTRTAKRIADVLHVKSKTYFSVAYSSLEPDPFDCEISTRYWKFAMRSWTTALKKHHRSEHQEADQEVTAAAVGGA